MEDTMEVIDFNSDNDSEQLINFDTSGNGTVSLPQPQSSNGM